MNRILGLSCLAWALVAPCAAADLYLSPSGKDADPGTPAQPFVTLERARDAVRAMKKEGRLPKDGVTVWLRGGTYFRQKTLTLTAQDSGDDRAPVVYRAVVSETPTLLSGQLLKASDFRPVGDPSVMARVDPSARGNVVQLDLAALGVRHAGPFPDVFHDGGGIVELYFDGQRMPLARWPNEGYTTMAKVVDKGDWSRGPGRHGGSFLYSDDRPARWAVDRGVWLDGFWRVPWQPETVRVKAIDPARRQITFAQPVNAGIGSKYAGPEGSGKENWRAVNLLEEIDRPGEWCIDFPSRTLYFWPPKPLERAAVVLADNDQPLVQFKDAAHVVFRGLTFEYGLGNGVEIQGGEAVLLAGCTFRNLGRTGVIVRGGRRHGVRSSDFYGLGHGGVYAGGGDRQSLTPAGHFIANNHIHHFGLVQRTYAPGICLGLYGAGDSVGNRVQHNLIHDAPHAAVLYGGNDNLFEANEVHHVALDSGDVGAFYTWHDWTSRGNLLRHNFVHDSPQANAFYMDDGDSGDTIEGNIVCRTSYGPFIGGGHDNFVRNNLIAECERGVHLDARGVPRHYDKDQGLIRSLESVHPGQPPWSEKYPQLVGLLTSRPELPHGNLIAGNVLVGCKVPLHLNGKEDLRFSTVGENLVLPGEGRVADDKIRSLLAPGSQVYQKLPGFKPIPWGRIGLYRDEDRTLLPTGAAERLERRPGNVFDSETDVRRSNAKP